MSNLFIPIKTAALRWHRDLPFSIEYDDIYYSAQNGVEQSRYVFVEGNDLIHRWQALPNNSNAPFNIAEAGFGTGLNFLLTWMLWEQYAPPSAQLHFISCEKHPLKKEDLIKSLSSWPIFKEHSQQLIDAYPTLTPGYHHISFSSGTVKLTLMLGDALECFEQLLICGDSKLESKLRSSFVDAWYLDGFAPSKNESMWSDSLIQVISMLSQKGTTLATYTAARTVKAALTKFGFTIEKRKGFGPKRHMISAVFSKNEPHRMKVRHTPWHVSLPEKQLEKKAIIIGAGLAGCFTAHSLATRGWKVTLIEENNSIGNGASGIKQAVLFPKLSAYRSPLTQFMLTSFLYAYQTYKIMLEQYQIGELKGTLLLAHNEKEKKAQQSLTKWLHSYPELGELVDYKIASKLTGVSLDKSGLHIPLSGWIDAPALCQILAGMEGISVLTNTRVDKLVFENHNWNVNQLKAKVLILANGYKVNRFQETQHLPIKPIRGQMTSISTTPDSSLLSMPLCGEGHVLPEMNGCHMIGATYGLGIDDLQIRSHDDELNIAKIDLLMSAEHWAHKPINNWVGIRASTPDYLPLVGQIPIKDKFITLFSGMETNAKRWIPCSGFYYSGLYSCTGFGSRGLTTIPLSAEWLAALINNEISCLPRNLIQAISPARFLRRDIVRGFI